MRAISGSFLGPKTIRARKNRKIVSEKLMRFIILPRKERRQSAGAFRFEYPLCSLCPPWLSFFTPEFREARIMPRSRKCFSVHGQFKCDHLLTARAAPPR